MIGTKSLNIEVGRRSFLSFLLVLLLISPYLVWLGWIPSWDWPALSEWLPVVWLSCKQALWSSILAVAAGFILFSAAQAWTSERSIKVVEAALLISNMVPALFLVLSIMSWVTPWIAFPFGMGAVIFAHVLINCGLVAISLDRTIQHRLGGMAETAWTLGASRALFWRRVGWPAIRGDVACIFLFVFGICFTSFSVPLILSGERLVTLEIAIYETIRMDGRWDKAVILAALQSLFLLGLAWMLPRPFWPQRSLRRHLPYFAWPRLRTLVFLPALIVVGGWLTGVGALVRGVWPQDLPLVESLITSFALGLSAGVLHLLLFLGVSYVTPNEELDRFLNGYLAPSPAITGFALVLIPTSGEWLEFFKLALALTLISFPLLYRWIVHSALSGVRSQVLTARTLGASWGMILGEIVWPQVAPQVLRACGLAALWASADFALSGILANGFNTVPLLMDSLLGSYRIEAAQLLMFPLLLVGMGLYFLFTGATRYVAR